MRPAALSACQQPAALFSIVPAALSGCQHPAALFLHEACRAVCLPEACCTCMEPVFVPDARCLEAFYANYALLVC